MRIVLISMTAVLLLIACGPDKTAERAQGASMAEHAELYTCGMHPDVIQEGPGTCPICGMDLTPLRTGAGSSALKRSSGKRKIKYWVAPMDPNYISEKPGKSPMGMDLVPVYEDEAPGASAPGVVSIDPVVVQNMGVRIEPVARQTVFRHVRSIGEVEVGEDQVSVVNLRFSGWIERIHVDKTGDPVKRGETLFELYSPDLVATQQEYLLALRTQGAESALARSARRKLDLWGLGERDVATIARSGEVQRTLPIRAPQSGYVLQKNVVEGARVRAGEDLYRIGDLSRIWVTAEVYEFDAPWIEVGQPAQMELSHEEGKVLEGKVAYIYPTLNEATRTLTVRLEFENPGLRLKPGMFATVYIQFRRMDDVLAVPTEAILDSGRRKLVFVSVGEGRFEPREIVTGLVGDHHVTEILSGLEAGEEVVVSGQFLLDSESQLQEAIRKRLARGSGAAAESDAPTPETVFSCPMHPEVLAAEPSRCPVCGMDLEERRGTAAELARVYGGHEHPPGKTSEEEGKQEPDTVSEQVRHMHESDAGAGTDESVASAHYVCPMHPEMVSEEPGRCPVCGMFLEKAKEPSGVQR
jgi:Cu(I)/Ag(I) efflux system membrane fusion protein/cobalt-zinc-cadmium efflux system membrane fusion protein